MSVSLKKFIPPHCPNPKCRFHKPLQDGWHFKRAGYYWRQNRTIRIQRFTCLHCSKSFSTQTFSSDYWQKKPNMASQLFFKVVGGMANRQIARDLRVDPATIDHHINRMARHCLLFHLRMIQDQPPPQEVVIDGFESFEWSQYYPIYLNLAIEKDSDFFWYFTDSPMRRKGRMTAEQKRRRAELEKLHGRPDPKAIEKDTRELLEFVLKDLAQAVVYSDCHQAYPRAIQQLDCDVTHHLTSGSDHRDQDNNLWPVNLADLLIRHCSSNHKRETIAWSKRRQGAADRLAIFLVWRNYVKPRREKERGSPTPAMMKGITDHPLTPEEIFSERIFRTHADLPPRWAEYYDRAVETHPLPVNLKHELKYAY